MRTTGRVWVGILIALLVATGGAGAEQDLGIDELTDVAAVEGKIAESLARVENAQTRQAQIDTEISGLADSRDEAQERLYERARALYRIRRSGMLPVAGGFDSLMAHLARVQRLSRMVKNDLDMMEFLGERGAALRAEKDQLATALQESEIAVRALEAKKEELEQSGRSASLFQETLRGEPQDAPDDSVGYGRIRVSGDLDDLGEGFAEMRGQLALPVQGSMRIGESSREGAPGLEFYGQPGGPVRAAADGRVAFARNYGAYGLMVIIDHGGSFYTVYGGLGSSSVQVGDWVGMGTQIATLDDGGPDAILFFEVRRGTRPLDARSWLGL
ncbi:MAG: peptidoglycan DD-metalloendopeptidase family protein [Polyangiales bacterium]